MLRTAPSHLVVFDEAALDHSSLRILSIPELFQDGSQLFVERFGGLVFELVPEASRLPRTAVRQCVLGMLRPCFPVNRVGTSSSMGRYCRSRAINWPKSWIMSSYLRTTPRSQASASPPRISNFFDSHPANSNTYSSRDIFRISFLRDSCSLRIFSTGLSSWLYPKE